MMEIRDAQIGEQMTNRSVVRRALAGAAGLAAATTLTACSDDAPDAAPAADRLAAGLAEGDLTDLTWSGIDSADADAELEELTAGMQDVSRTVEVADVREADDGAGRVVDLDITWDTDTAGDEDWAYTTTATLERVDDSWRAVWAPDLLHPDLTEGARLALNRRPAERGEIRGAGDEVIVTGRPVYRIGVDKTKVGADSTAAAARELAGVIDVDADEFAEQANAAGPEAFVEAITLRDADAAPVLPRIDEIAGAVTLPDTMSLAPTREFARPILGTVGEATAEIVENADGKVAAGDVVGLSGMQQQYDDVLRGSSGTTVEVVPPETETNSEQDGPGDGSAGGDDPVVVHEREPVPGADVSTTLDPDLQTRAEEILADVGPASAITAIQPSTGAVVAAASGPGSDGQSTATLGQYAPGSTFKIVTALAMLRAGLSVDTAMECAPEATVEGKSFTNYSDYPSSAVGEIPLRSAIANSCNTALIGERDAVSQSELADAGAALGLGSGHDLGAPAFLGEVPAEANATGHAASMIGQGEVLASPLAMATAAASVAAGKTVEPVLVTDAGSGDGGAASGDETEGAAPSGESAEAESAAESESASTLTADEAATLSDLMRAVVSEGSGAFLADVPGESVGAKTGTAEYGSETPPRTHAWMIATQGDLAVAVFVEDGASGSETAGPLLTEFLSG